MEKKRDVRTIIYHFKLPTYFSLAKHKIDVFYSNIVVALGPMYELSSSVGSAILYGHEFPLSTSFKRARNRWELVCYGVIHHLEVFGSFSECHSLVVIFSPLMFDVHQESTFIKDISLRNELATVMSKELWVVPEK